MNEEEKQELETLRAEKLRREQVERARAALERGGVPQSFAPLLAGGDDGDTGRRTEEFRAAYQASLAEDVKSRLPASARQQPQGETHGDDRREDQDPMLLLHSSI